MTNNVYNYDEMIEIIKSMEIKPSDLLDIISEYFNIPYENIKGKKVDYSHTTGRQIARYLIWNIYDFNYRQFGEFLDFKSFSLKEYYKLEDRIKMKALNMTLRNILVVKGHGVDWSFEKE